MSLGKNLAGFRKQAGLTQQQLGEHLSLSPQAISKWENDLAEPDLSTLRALANLYKVSVDNLINPDLVTGSASSQETGETITQEKDNKKDTIGFCQTCGSIVTEDMLGEREPIIICKQCLAKRIMKEKKEAERAAYEEERRKNVDRSFTIKKLRRSLITASVVTLLLIIALPAIFGSRGAIMAIISSYTVFSYIACLFYECFVSDALMDWTGKTFEFPGLIFTFDLDGCLWLIGMKLLFWALGILFSALAALIGITLGLIVAPFSFPFIMYDMHRSIKDYTQSKYLDYEEANF